MRQSTNQTNDTGLTSCVFCEQGLNQGPGSFTILENAGNRFPAHLGCWYDHAHDQWQDQQLEREIRDEVEPPDPRVPPDEELILTQKAEIEYERWLDAAAEGRGL